jgi:hypothetical protein
MDLVFAMTCFCTQQATASAAVAFKGYEGLSQDSTRHGQAVYLPGGTPPKRTDVLPVLGILRTSRNVGLCRRALGFTLGLVITSGLVPLLKGSTFIFGVIHGTLENKRDSDHAEFYIVSYRYSTQCHGRRQCAVETRCTNRKISPTRLGLMHKKCTHATPWWLTRNRRFCRQLVTKSPEPNSRGT